MECENCNYGRYDEFYEDFVCHKNPSEKTLWFFPKANAPKCERKRTKRTEETSGCSGKIEQRMKK